MKVQEIMSKAVFCVGINQSLNDAAQLMWEHNCGCAPVVDAHNQVIGMVTDRDIAMAAYFNGKALADIPVSDTQSRQLVCCGPQDKISDVEAMMQAHQVHRIPVTGERLEPLGIVSLNDIALACNNGIRGIRHKEVSETLAAICRPHFPIETASAAA